MENWLKKLEMDSLADMNYLDAFCAVMELDDPVPEDVFFRLFSEVTEEEIREMMDQLRCRNGNLEISVARQDTTVTEL